MIHVLIENYFKKDRVVFASDFVVAEYEYSPVDNIKDEFVKQVDLTLIVC